MTSPESGYEAMMTLVRALPDQLAAGFALPERLSLERPAAPPRDIVYCGMGGSAIAGDLAAPLVEAAGARIHVHRDYALPGWADANVLAIVSSYSGNTEETLDALASARERGARVIGLSSGGRLTALGAEAGFPVVALPPGLPPRASLGFGLGALVRILGDLGVLPDAEAEVAAAVATLREGAAVHDADDAPTAALAGRLAGRFTVIYTSGAEAHAAGSRLKAQLNENGKAPAYAAGLPELDHNDIVGWTLTPAERERFALVALRGGREHPRNARRTDVTLGLLAREFPLLHVERARGSRPLARILSLVQFGDHLSCRLARARGIDPVPVARIEDLKRALADPSDERP